jgi:hypothetical protein
VIAIAVSMVLARHYLALGDAVDDGTPQPAYVLAAISFLMCAAALIVLKPRVPARSAGQTVEAYWADRDVMQKAILVWFIAEGSGVMAALSYFLGGGIAAAAMIVLAIAVFWMNGPTVFEEQR